MYGEISVLLLEICLATIGVCVFRCGNSGCRTFCFNMKGEKMEDKILIKGVIDRKTKNILQKGPIILFGISVLCALILTFEFEYTHYIFGVYHTTLKNIGWALAFQFEDVTSILCFLIFLIACIAMLPAIILTIIYLISRKCELCITENSVKGKTLFGKEVVLPLYMVSAYSTRKFLSTVAVATSSGITKFALIGNYYEIGKVLSQKINERQEATATPKSTPAPQSNSMDDLKKLKDLLDAGIITQEEFDAKKKQLLGL